MSTTNWKIFETLLFETALDTIKKLLARSSSPYYVIALYPHNGDHSELPVIGGNSIKNAPEEGPDHIGDFNDPRWRPESWGDQNIGFKNRELIDLFDTLQGSHTSKKIAQKMKTITKKVVKKLYKKVLKEHNITDDFLLFYHIGPDSIDLIRGMLHSKQFAKLFPRQDPIEMERLTVASFSLEEQITFYIERLGKHPPDGIPGPEAAKKLVEIGEPAIPEVMKLIGDFNRGEIAAGILAGIGVVDQEIITPLRQHLRSGTAYGSALLTLGDIDYIINATNSDNHFIRNAAIRTLCLPFQSGKNIEQSLFNYTEIEKLLHRNDPEVTDLILDGLGGRHGTRYLTLESEIDTAIEATRSPHWIIRKNAIRSLFCHDFPARGLASKVIPALINLLGDPVIEIKELALQRISLWKKKAKPYRSEIEHYLKDKDIGDGVQRLLEKL